jgi:hypothetical protein
VVGRTRESAEEDADSLGSLVAAWLQEEVSRIHDLLDWRLARNKRSTTRSRMLIPEHM